MSQKDNVDVVDVRADLKLMETELVKIQDELAKAETSRNQLIQRLHQVSGAAAYLRGKLPQEEISPEMVAEEFEVKTEEKHNEPTEEKSEA